MRWSLVLAVYIFLSGCGERASHLRREKTGRFISTDDYHEAANLNEQPKSMTGKTNYTNEEIGGLDNPA